MDFSGQHVLFKGGKRKRDRDDLSERYWSPILVWIIEVESGMHTALSGTSGDCIWSEELAVIWEVMETMLAQSFVVSACWGTVTAGMGSAGGEGWNPQRRRHLHSVHKVYWIWKPGTSPKSKHSITKQLFTDAKGSQELPFEERMPRFQRQRCQRTRVISFCSVLLLNILSAEVTEWLFVYCQPLDYILKNNEADIPKPILSILNRRIANYCLGPDQSWLWHESFILACKRWVSLGTGIKSGSKSRHFRLQKVNIHIYLHTRHGLYCTVCYLCNLFNPLLQWTNHKRSAWIWRPRSVCTTCPPILNTFLYMCVAVKRLTVRWRWWWHHRNHLGKWLRERMVVKNNFSKGNTNLNQACFGLTWHWKNLSSSTTLQTTYVAHLKLGLQAD